MSGSLDNPQRVPSDHCYTVLQDHGESNGGWGPAALVIPGVMEEPMLFIYTGDAPQVLAVVQVACRSLAQATGKPTRLVRFTQREDVFVVGGAS